MQTKTTLFELIQQLSEDEKGRFGMYLKRYQKKGSKYTDMFKGMQKMKNYDEEKLKKRLQIKSFPSYKTRLFNHLLAYLRETQNGKDINSRVRNLIEEAQILIKRKFYPEATKRLESAHELAEEFMLFELQLEINGYRRTIAKKYEKNKLEERIRLLKREKDALLAQMENYYTYADLWDEVSVCTRQHAGSPPPEVKEELSQLMEHQLLKEESNAMTIRARILFLDLWGNYAYICEDYEAAKNYFHSLITLWKDYDFLIIEYPERFQIHLNNYLNTCHNAEDYTEFEEWLDQLATLEQRGLPEGESNHDYLSLLYLMNTGQFEKLATLIPEIYHRIKVHYQNLPDSRVLSFYHNFSVYYFIIGEYSQANHWAEQILQAQKTEHRIDLQSFANVMKVIIMFELGEINLVADMTRNVQRRIKRSGETKEIEILLLKTLGKLVNQPVSEHNELFSSLKSDLEAISQKAEKTILAMEEIQFWIQSKLTGRSIRDLFMESLGRKKS